MDKVFIRREKKSDPGFDVQTIMGNRKTKGALGIEIEVEGTRLPKGDDTPAPWKYVHDGSLRGHDNAEYVLARPIEFSALPDALDKLWAVFKTHKSTFDDSNRTSVHVHMNVQTFHFNRLTSFIALYLIVEEVLTKWCGENRVGNLFCLRAKDAPAVVTNIKKFIQNDGRHELRDTLHYAALNIHALAKYGSLEVRTLRGVSDPQIILDWVGILQRLYDLSKEFTDPRDICAMFSGTGPLAFFTTILGDKADIVRAGVSMSDDEIRDSMYDGVRMAQDVCYCRDWSVFKPIDLAPDPFGRSARKIAASLASAIGGQPVAVGGYGEYEVEYGEPEYDDPMPQTISTAQYIQQMSAATSQPLPPVQQTTTSEFWEPSWAQSASTPE